jgi:prolyl-tRNA editing enzyme YbaK/EbsC (Cys-tRNA(Pro) deacylase)
MSGSSVERVRAALLAAGHPDTIQAFPEGTRSAAEAAAAVGCDVAQIAKSIVFRAAVRSAEGEARSRESAGVQAVRSAEGEARSRESAGLNTDQPILVIASGANRVDMAKVAAATGLPVKRADGNWVRDATGFAIGGVAPLGHLAAPVVLVDAALTGFDRIWAAAGSSMHVFETTPEALLRISGGRLADIAEEST